MRIINTDPNNLMDTTAKKPSVGMVFPKEGGIKSYFKGRKYPYPGYRNREAAKTIEFIKRMPIEMIDFLTSVKKIDLFKLLFLKGLIKKLTPRWLNFAIWAMRDVRHKPELYSRPVREIYRLFNILIEREGDNAGMKEKWEKIRDISCMILEVDNAYRFRLQDILSEMDIDKIKFDKADKYFTSFNKGYNYGNKT